LFEWGLEDGGVKIFGKRGLFSIVSRAWGGCLLVVLTCLWQGVSPASAEDKKPLRVVEDKQFELIDIPLAPWPRGGMLDYEPTFYGFWLDNNHLVMSVLQDMPDAYAKHLERIVMIDARTGSYRVLVEQGHVNCRNTKYKVMAYLPYELSYYRGSPSRKIPDDYLFIGLDDEGQIVPLTGPSPIERNCAPAGSTVGLPPSVRQGVNLKEDHGYIDKSDPGDFKNFKHGTAKLVRPGKEPIELGIPTIAVGWPVYLPYFDKYLMNASDIGRDGTTRDYLQGMTVKFALYWLVGLDGKVDSFPYPKVIFDYGFVEFSYLWPTPYGVLIDITGGRYAPEAGLFLLQGEKLIRIWGGNPSLNPSSHRRGTLERSYVLNISPDGCRVVFLHARKYPLPKDKNPDPIPLSILNICKEQ
jgi:hypothetical protein